MTPKQKTNFELRRGEYEKTEYESRSRQKKYTAEEIVLKVLQDKPDDWFYTWELMGATKHGWLSHATHATLRKAEQKGLIQKAHIGTYVVYTSKQSGDVELVEPVQKQTPTSKKICYEVYGVVHLVSENDLEEFLQRFPNATKI